MIEEKLKFDTEVKIERAHRVGKPRASFEIMEDGSRKKIPPRPVIARLACCKQKVAMLKAARDVKSKEISFSRTFRQEHCIGELIKYRS